jgi:hypothetical protein
MQSPQGCRFQPPADPISRAAPDPGRQQPIRPSLSLLCVRDLRKNSGIPSVISPGNFPLAAPSYPAPPFPTLAAGRILAMALSAAGSRGAGSFTPEGFPTLTACPAQHVLMALRLVWGKGIAVWEPRTAVFHARQGIRLQVLEVLSRRRGCVFVPRELWLGGRSDRRTCSHGRPPGGPVLCIPRHFGAPARRQFLGKSGSPIFRLPPIRQL